MTQHQSSLSTAPRTHRQDQKPDAREMNLGVRVHVDVGPRGEHDADQRGMSIAPLTTRYSLVCHETLTKVRRRQRSRE